MLPPGTTVVVSLSQINVALSWEGKSGQQIVHLQQNFDESEYTLRDDAITGAAALFRSIVGLVVIEDALAAGAWPEARTEAGSDDADTSEQDQGSERSGAWNRTREA